LRRPPLQIAAGTIEAAHAHVVSLSRASDFSTGRSTADSRRIDALVARLAPSEEAEPGQKKQHNAEILASLPGVGGPSSPRCSLKPRMLYSDAITPPCGV
jgi:hypothetical protein